MKHITAVIALLFLTNNYAFGQRSLTKEEILNYWNLPSEKQTRDPIAIVNSDSAMNVRLSKFVDSLQANNIDSVIVFSTAYPGYISSSRCDTGMFPITTFIIWNKDKVTYIKKLKGNCLSEVTISSSAHLFDFYSNNSPKLQSEFFMPVILGGQLNKDKTISYSMSWIDHELNYSFYYKIGQHHKSFHFCQSYLNNKESLFKDYNLSLSVYKWWQQVKQATDKID